MNPGIEKSLNDFYNFTAPLPLYLIGAIAAECRGSTRQPPEWRAGLHFVFRTIPKQA